MKSHYNNTIKRWRYNSLNNKMAVNDDSVPIFDDRIVVRLKTVLSGYRLVEDDNYFYSIGREVKPFIVTREQQMYPGDSGHMIVDNDPVNAIEAALDTSVSGNPEIEAERMIGNYRMGLRRHIVHLGDSLSIEEYTDLENSGLTELPFFPPLPAVFDEADHISMVTSNGGFKDYMKSTNPRGGPSYSALQATELTGRKIIIWDGADSKFRRHVDTSDYPVSTADSKNVKITDIETVLNGASGKGGLADIHANLGAFLPSEKEWGVYNIPGQCVVETTDTKYSVRIYNAAWDTLICEFSIAKVDGKVTIGDNVTKAELTPDGDIVLTAGTTVITAVKNGTATVNANGSKVEVLSAGVININAGNNQVNIDASKVDVTVSGTMDVN